MSDLQEYTAWENKAKQDIETVDMLIASPRSKDPEVLYDELDALTQWLSRLGELLADAESLYEAAMGAQAEQIIATVKDLKPSLITAMAKGRCSDLKRTYRRIERQNAALTHAIDAVRSMLSYQKEIHKFTPNQNGR